MICRIVITSADGSMAYGEQFDISPPHAPAGEILNLLAQNPVIKRICPDSRISISEVKGQALGPVQRV